MALSLLPRLGVGISAEPGSGSKGIDAVDLAATHPDLCHFVEYGTDLDRGLDDHIQRWTTAGHPTTYHFLDVNLEESEDLDADWLRGTAENARRLGAAWLCGDAGLWHFGTRDRGHQLLLPPILTRDSAYALADNILALEAATGFRVLPENPPGSFYLGDLHILDYFATVAERSGCGLLLDCAHLAIFQRLRGLAATEGLDGFPLDRVIELHVAGGTEQDHDGLPFIDDDHTPEPLPETWAIFEHVVPRAANLRAVVYECEHNPVDDVLANFARLNQAFPRISP